MSRTRADGGATRRLLLRTGLGLETTGAALTVWIDHGLPPSRALARMSVPAHVLLVFGTALTVVGAASALLTRRPTPGSRLPRRGSLAARLRSSRGPAVGLVLALLIISVSYIARGTPVSASATRSTLAASTTPGSSEAASTSATTTAGATNDNVFDAATQQLLDTQLAEARQVAASYPTLAVALADGFTQAAPYAPRIGSHYMKYSRIYLPFDVSAPSMLLFDGDVPSSKIVGLAYYVYSSQGPPAGFAGPLDHWHQHWSTCVDKTGAHFDGDDDSIGCRRRGHNAWMLHLWVVGNQQSPQVVFSENCNILT
jgi:hypothetical protein